MFNYAIPQKHKEILTQALYHDHRVHTSEYKNLYTYEKNYIILMLEKALMPFTFFY